MGGGGQQRRYVRAQEPCFAVPQMDVAFRELRASRTQALDLPALEGEARFEGFLDREFVARLLVAGNGRGLRRVLLFWTHGRTVVRNGPRLYGSRLNWIVVTLPVIRYPA